MYALKKPSVFDYQDYRKYLKDIFEYLGESSIREKFSYRSFSEKAGFKSPGFISAVIKSAKNLSDQSIIKLTKALELTTAEADFFHRLVHFNQSKSIDERLFIASNLIAKRSHLKAFKLDKAYFDIYQNWYVVPILVLIGSPDFKEDADHIAKMFNPKLRPSKVKKAIKNLEALELVKRDENQRLYCSHSILNTADEVSSLAIIDFHRKMIKLGSESIERYKRELREISCATMNLDRENFDKLKKMVQEFRANALQLTKQNESEDKEVIQLNFQLFPLTSKSWAKDGQND